jgi:hypothetical protein
MFHLKLKKNELLKQKTKQNAPSTWQTNRKK